MSVNSWCMARKISLVKCLAFITVLYSLTLTFMFVYYEPGSRIYPGVREPKLAGLGLSNSTVPNKSDTVAQNVDAVVFSRGDNPEWGKHKMAVIVPFRDRFEELLEFAPFLHNYLVKKKVRHKIYVINQVDNLRFNRASLINIGVLESERACDYIAMHDVDLLPLNEDLDYSFPSSRPRHVAAPDLHPLYHYPTFIGGILLMTRIHFELVNGMSNRYYGWGREDDELYVRLKKRQLLPDRPENISTGFATFRHIHDKRVRPRDNMRYFDQKKRTSRLDSETGMRNIRYDVTSRHQLLINGAPVTMLEVKLSCDFKKTKWCLKPEDHRLLEDDGKPQSPAALEPVAEPVGNR